MPDLTEYAWPGALTTISITTSDGDRIPIGDMKNGQLLQMTAGVLVGVDSEEVSVQDTDLGQMAADIGDEQMRGRLIVQSLQAERLQLVPELEDMP